MKILFVDDSTTRSTIFRANSIGCIVEFLSTADGAIQALKDTTYDIIYLDHDLEEHHYSEYDENLNKNKDGRYIAQNILDFSELNKKTTIVLHSLNTNGRAKMKEILDTKYESVVEFPFAWNLTPQQLIEFIKNKDNK